MIFDTDVLIWAARGDSSAARVIDATANRAISIISLMELLQGARSKPEARRIRQSLLASSSESCRFPSRLAQMLPRWLNNMLWHTESRWRTR